METLVNRKIIIVGAGGIGSYLVREISALISKNQIKNSLFVLYDDDIVNTENLTYQNFEEEDITDFKAETLSIRYELESRNNILFVNQKVKSEDILDEFDVVISAVDSNDFRKLLYKWSEKHPERFWIDLRSEGRTITYYQKHEKHTEEFMLKTLSEKHSGSCQLSYELAENKIQLGNVIIGEIGAQLLLNFIRGEYSSPFKTLRI